MRKSLMRMTLRQLQIFNEVCDLRSYSRAAEEMSLTQPAVSLQIRQLEELIGQRGVRGLVLGLPLNMDGSAGPRVQATRAFARNCAALERPILLWDERWSTQSAERAMISQDMSRAKRATRIDSHAAAIILQAALDRFANGWLD